MEIKLDNGKYTWAFDEKVGRLTCLRHGEPWRDETGDGAVLALLMRACELEDIVKGPTIALYAWLLRTLLKWRKTPWKY